MQKSAAARMPVWSSAAVVAVCIVAGCGDSSTRDDAESSSSTSATTTASSAAPTSTVAAALEPIQTDTEFEYYVGEANKLLERSCFDISQAFEAQCMIDASYAARWLDQLLSRLTMSYPETRAATQKAINDLNHWWEVCARTNPNTQERRECIVYMPRKGQTLSIQFAWYGERKSG